MLIEQYVKFIKESNTIEGIYREPTEAEVSEFIRFINLEMVQIKDLKKFVSIYAPGNVIRDKPHLNVSIGGYYAPPGSTYIKTRLRDILNNINNNTPYRNHVEFEMLHPFTDGNGRSGRALWGVADDKII